MSAIAGILFFDGAVAEPELIGTLTHAMKDMGPDAQDHWAQGPVALGHCMLRTTPESLAERQPLLSQDKQLVLVWDGRLDNREELRRVLIEGGHSPRDGTDPELVLQGYALWGEQCPEHLLGDFAFAVWDLSQQKLFCARDHMGARPFYYTRNEHFFAFASDDEALPALPGVSAAPNEERIAYCLVPEFDDFDYAHFWLEDVLALQAAQSLTVSVEHRLEKHDYWKLEAGPESRYKSEEECLQAFLDVFSEAVRCRLRASGDIAAMMSGGLDTAGMIAMSRRLLPELLGKELHTYSAISDEPETCMESRCILSLAKSCSGQTHFVSVPSFSGMVNEQDLLEAAWSRAHPVDNSILLPSLMCLAASRDGHRVMLHGVCGDLTLYFPHDYIARLLKAGKWRGAWYECQAASKNNIGLQGRSPLMLFARNAWSAFAPQWLRQLIRTLRIANTGSPLEGSLIKPRFAQRLRLDLRLRTKIRKARPLSDMHMAHLRVLSPPHGIASSLSGFSRVARRYGVELRDPWGDKRVVEFFLRLPLEYRIREGWSKYLVRRAFAAELAPEVRWRKDKEHLGWNFVVRALDGAHSEIERLLGDPNAVLAKYADMAALRDRYQAYLRSDGDHERITTFDALSLGFWLERLAQDKC